MLHLALQLKLLDTEFSKKNLTGPKDQTPESCIYDIYIYIVYIYIFYIHIYIYVTSNILYGIYIYELAMITKGCC